MSYLQRDVVMVPVPFSDLTTFKRRPVLVISSSSHNSSTTDILVAAITSNLASPFGGVAINTTDMDSGVLPRSSMVRPDKLYSLSQAIVVKTFGRLGQDRFNEVLSFLDHILGR